MRAPSTWHTSKRTSFTMMSPTKPWKQRRECRKAKPQASLLRFALVWIPAPAEILSGRLDPAERHLRTVGEGKFQPRRLNGGHGTARSTIELSALEAKSAVGQTEVQTAPVTLPPGCAKLGTRPLRLDVAPSLALKPAARLKQTNALLRLFGRPTTRQWEKLPCRILALARDDRSDPIVRCALCYNTIAERRSGSTTECGRVLSQPPRDRRGSWRRLSVRSWRRPLGF